MAYENISLNNSNFCLGPQAGTICSVDTSSPDTRLQIKDLSGGVINSLIFSFNIKDDNVKLEYVGPRNISSLVSGASFFTLEKIDSTKCMIRRWEPRVSFGELLLKEEIIKYTTGNIYYDINDFAVEHYERALTDDVEYNNYIDVSSHSRVTTGMKLFIGPSTDSDNLGQCEDVYVSSVGNYFGKKRIYLTGPTSYQYREGDPVSFYNYVYLFSSLGYANDHSNGSLIKLNAYSWNIDSIDTKGFYKNVTSSRWCNYVDGIASIISTNMLFVRPYDSYQNWRSMFLNNVDEDRNTVLPVYDVIFDNYSVYKLQIKTTLRDDDGNINTYNWDSYNYQLDTLLPYSNSLVGWSNKSLLYGINLDTDFFAQVRDQYHVGLKDMVLNFYIDTESGDSNAELDPLSGVVTTDSNGEASVGYLSGSSYNGHTNVTMRTDGSSTYTGSEYVWSSNNIITDIEAEVDSYIKAKKEKSGIISSIKQLNYFFKRVNTGTTYFKYFGEDNENYDYIVLNSVSSVSGGTRLFVGPSTYPSSLGEVETAIVSSVDSGSNTVYLTENLEYKYKDGDPITFSDYLSSSDEELEEEYPNSLIFLKSFFTSPGGDWGIDDELDAPFLDPDFVEDWLPSLYRGIDRQEDAPFAGDGYGFSNWPYRINKMDEPYFIGNQITLVEEFESSNTIKSVTDFMSYDDESSYGYLPYIVVYQDKQSINDGILNQLNSSLHTNWVDGVAYDELFTYLKIDQFVFIEDASPSFWSEKIPKETDIWIRLRPFAYSLNADSLRMYIREISYLGDTGYYEVTDDVNISSFDAGGGLLGLDLDYDPPNDFKHASLVFVKIEVYDNAPDPNYIYVNYWFEIVPDYKAPYLDNLNPAKEQDNVPVDTDIYFELKDDGAGVDINSLECFLNSISIKEYELNIEKVSNYYYKVTCDISSNLYYGKTYNVNVKVKDLSENSNKLNTSYSFYTSDSEAVTFVEPYPGVCKRGLDRFENVSVIALAGGNSIDRDTIKMQIFNKTVNPDLIPIIYRTD